MSAKYRSRMSLLTGSRARFRGVCHNHSEVDGGATAEGLADDRGTDHARGVCQGYRGGAGDSSAHSEPRVAAGRRPAARTSKLEPYKPMVNRLLDERVWNARVILREIQAAGYQGGASMLRAYI
jgi:hypothetical protein